MLVRILFLFTVGHNVLRWLIKAVTESVLTSCLKNFGTNACGPVSLRVPHVLVRSLGFKNQFILPNPICCSRFEHTYVLFMVL